MVKKTYIKKTVYLLSVVILLLTMLSLFSAVGTAKADSTESYSNVMDDLRKADNFDVGLYPSNSKDYSLSVISLAESSSGQLFVYVYQPCARSKKLVATSINISTSLEDIKYRNYKLKLLNSSGVFFKYVVEDLSVNSSTPMRSYSISSIYRAFDESIDAGASHGNVITEVNFDVSKQFFLGSINGESFCNVVDIETITITEKFVGMVRYFDGYHFFGNGSCDSHFVAFDTDKPIDKLLEADVYYTTQEYILTDNSDIIEWISPDSLKFKEVKDCYAELSYTQRVEHSGSGWGAGTYKWDRIETVDQFLEENTSFKNVFSGAALNVKVASTITDEGKQALKDKKWVLRFAETKYSQNTTAISFTEILGTIVGDVSILRLKFETDGVTYNLGVIDNKQTGALDENGVNKPINKEEIEFELSDKGKWIISIIIIIIVIIIAIVFLPFTLKLLGVLGKFLWAILKSLWWLICLPFKVIKALIEKIKDSRG